MKSVIEETVKSEERVYSLPFHYSWVVLVTVIFVVFSSIGLARFGYSTILPAMQVGLGMDNTQAGILATVSLTGYLAFSIISGVLASRFKPRLVISIGLALIGVGMLLTGMADGFFPAIVGQILTGIGSGASNVPAMAMLAAWFAPRRRGLAAGIAVAGTSIAIIVIGPLVPRILVTYGEYGWRISWFVFSGMALVVTIGSLLFLRNHPAELGLRPLGAEANSPIASSQTAGLQWGRVYRSTAVWHLGLVYIAFGFSYIIYATFFIKQLITIGGYTQEAAGGLFMMMGWFSLLCGVIWGAVSDVIGRKLALIILYLIHAVAFSLFALWPVPFGFTLSVVLFGLSAWSIPAIMAAASGDMLGPRLAPAAFGFVTIFFGIGQVIGPSVAGAIADMAGSFFLVFLIAGGAALLGAFGASFLHPVSPIADDSLR